MAHAPQPALEPGGPYGEAVERLSSIGAALRRGGEFGAGPAPDLVIGAAVAGLDALVAVDRSPEPAEASLDMVERIRRELAEINGTVFR